MPLDVPQRDGGWRASLALGFERRGARTVLARRRHDGPLVVQKALHPEGEGVCHAIVVHPPSGLVGGDALELAVEVDAGAHALLATPGAAKWYRSTGRFASQSIRFSLAPGACLEWLPQENILFDGSLAELRWSADLAAGARLIAWDIACLGRTASGETYAAGVCRIDTTLAREGRLAWTERGRFAAGAPVLRSSVGLGGHPVFGTFMIAAPVIAPEWVRLARDLEAREGEGGVTALPGLLLARYRGASTEAAREYFGALWRALRAPVLGREAVAPRIWST
jgi:urease accessory protein